LLKLEVVFDIGGARGYAGYAVAPPKRMRIGRKN